MGNKIILFFVFLSFFAGNGIGLAHAHQINVVNKGTIKSIDIDKLTLNKYSTIYHHPLMNPENTSYDFEGVLIKNILTAANVSVSSVKNVHLFGRDNYLVSLNARTVLNNYEPMIISENSFGNKTIQSPIYKLEDAIPFVVYKNGLQLSRNYWCWWVTTIMVESSNESDYSLAIIYRGKKHELTNNLLDKLRSLDYLTNTSVQRGITASDIASRSLLVGSFKQYRLVDLLRILYDNISLGKIYKITLKNLNGVESQLNIGTDINSNDLYIGLTGKDSLFQSGYPAVLSVAKDDKYILKNWPYLTEIVIEEI